MKLTGKLEKRDLEGGLWQFVDDSGKRWTLLGHVKGASGDRVEVEGQAEDGGGFGIGMAGAQLKVSKVRKL